MEEFLYDDYYEDYPEEVEDRVPVGWGLEGAWEGCMVPVAMQMGTAVGVILTISAFYRVSSSLLSTRSPFWRDLISTTLGVALLTLIIGPNGVWVAAIAFLHVILLKCVQRRIISSAVHTGVGLVAPILFEFLDSDADRWQQIRGVNMGIAMKGISLAFDGGCVPWYTAVGYIMHPPALIFGPWRPLEDYTAAPRRALWSVQDALSGLWSLFVATFTLLTSNCLVASLVPSSWRWLEAYRDALSFRLGHYFVSHVARASLIVAASDTRPIVHALATEVPRSLVDVAVAWNLPMHAWLKRYIFDPCRNRGAVFALIITYLISALLHGLSPPLSAVLMHLAVASWAEFTVRRKISSVFGACIAARKCSNCKHSNSGFRTIAINILFGAIALLQLTYLGALFDGTQHTSIASAAVAVWDKWRLLGFAGHWILAGAVVFHIAS
ncbi:protein-serine O-palmitoleoyltransferase porcupine [Phlebotomus argentipes]|uniref:protein-serine O-palmitoleoyltransferase porcupine n=1 Tax=Phlebotomus argentipes TaxID=94469 RepID=UPI00289350BF|nr:protein-serine O-palmitoleoyltransferase porcupine [Phlebotomus argentipes]